VGRVGVVLDSDSVESQGAKIVDVKVDPGGSATETAQHTGEAGIEAIPLDGDFAVYISDGSGSKVVVGYFDPKLERKAQKGEIRIVSRAGPGEVSCSIFVRANGEIEIEANDVKIVADVTITGDLTVSGEVTAKSATAPVKLSSHLHPTSTGPSGAPTPGT